jgi:hypothetical protein
MRAKQTVATVLLSLQLLGCGQWAPVTRPEPAAASPGSAGTMRIVVQRGTGTETREERLILYGASVSPDSVRGMLAVGTPVAVPRSDVVRIERRALNSTTTLIGVALMALVTVSAVAVMANPPLGGGFW